MTSLTPEGGIVIDWADLRRLDTREMPWQSRQTETHEQWKVLARDATGSPTVFLLWIAPRAGEVNRRCYHRTTREFMFVLHGAFTTHGSGGPELSTIKNGYFLAREAGEIHDLEVDASSDTGCTMLVWRDGPGTLPGESEFASETVVLAAGEAEQQESFAADGEGLIARHPGLTIYDTREMPWKPFAGLAGSSTVKVLYTDDRGRAMVWLIWLPPGQLRPDAPSPRRHYHRTIREHSFMLAGELPHWEYRNRAQTRGTHVLVRPGYFMDRDPGSLHGNEPGPTSDIGCVLLQWRDGVGNYVNEPEAAWETVDVPYDA